MKRSILILLVVLSACVGGILGSIVTLRFLDDYAAITNQSTADNNQYLRVIPLILHIKCPEN